MNRTETMRQQAGMAQPMLGLNGPFINNGPQPGPASMNLLGVGGGPPNNSNPPIRYGQPPGAGLGPGQPRMMIRQGNNPALPPHNMPGGPSMPGASPHMGNMANHQLGGLGNGFPAHSGGMLSQGPPGPGNPQVVRRVASQPQMGSGGMGGHMPGMPQAGMNGMNPMGMNPQTSMPGQIRAVHQQHQQQQQQQHLRQQQLAGGHMSPDMGGSIGMNRSGSGPGPGPGPGPGGVPGGPGGNNGGGGMGGMGPGSRANGPGQMPVMNSLQPASMGAPSANGMPSGPHQNNFQNMPGMHPSHQRPPISSSPGPHGGMNPNLSMNAGPSQPIRRTPDNGGGGNGMFMFGNGSSFPPGPGPGPGNGGNRPVSVSSGMGGGPLGMGGGGGIPINAGGGNGGPYVPSTPPNPSNMMIDSQSLPPSMGGTPNGTPSRQNNSFTLTPAQQFQQMQGMDGSMSSEGYGSFSMPPRPPSQAQSQMQHNPGHPPFSHQQTPLQHQSPHPNDLATNIYPPVSGPSPGRPHSQNQNHPQAIGRSPSRSASTQPRAQPILPPNMMHQNPGRMPPGSQPAPPQGRPQSSSGIMPGVGPPPLPNIAPRPPAPGSAPGSSTATHPPHPLPSVSAPPAPGPSHLGPQSQQQQQQQQQHQHQHPPSQQPHPHSHLPPPHPHPHPDSSSPSSSTPPGPQPNPPIATGPGSDPLRPGVGIPPGAVSGGLPLQPDVSRMAIPRPLNAPSSPTALGHGQGLIRLLQFSGNLASESKQKHQLSWWNELIREYFTPKAIMRFTLWRDNLRTEAKPFEIGVPILPRFLLVTTQSGVKSMTLTLDGARERLYGYGHAIVECVAAVWTYKYNNGYTVALRGPLTVHVVVTAAPPPPPGATGAPSYLLKFEDFQFDATLHEKYIALDSITGLRGVGSPKQPQSQTQTPRMRNVPPGAPAAAAGSIAGGSSGAINGAGPFGMEDSDRDDESKWEEPRVMIERGFMPGEPVNAFGIPQATMRCLELAESVAQMTDLIVFSNEHQLGPLDALQRMALKIRETMPPSQQQPMMNGASHPNNNLPPGLSPGFGGPPGSFSSSNGSLGGSPMTLYSSAPPSVTNPSSQTPSTMASSPQNGSPSAQNSPRKQHKTIPSQSGGSSSTAPSSSSNPGSTNNTPALSNASLKRKQVTDSPGTGNADQAPPQKRTTRKRGRTGGG